MNATTSESLLSKLHRTVIVQGATAGVAGNIDDMFEGAEATDVSGLSAGSIGDGSLMHHGPIEGGAALDRPSAGYMAQASLDEGVSIDSPESGVSNIARDINQAATLEIDGQEIQVLDYIPGGDMIQLAAGQANPGQVIMQLAHQGITREMMMNQSGGTIDVQQAMTENSASGIDQGSGAQDQNGSSNVGVDAGVDASAGAAGAAGAAAMQRVPDADENARDLEALIIQHRQDVDTAVQSTDIAQVHTEIHAHGRTLEINTDFEATKSDNEEERKDASEHVTEVSQNVRNEVNHYEPGMHMRSRIAAHLDAASRDDGMSL